MEAFETYKASGNCVIRGVFSPADTNTIRRGALQIYRHILGTADPKSGANTLHLSDVAKQSVPWMERFVIWTISRFTQSEAYQLYEKLYGTYIAFPLLKCIIRYQRPDHVASFLPYHQDADGSKPNDHIVNCWTALHHCGVDAPGVELLNVALSEPHFDLFISETLDKASKERWNEQYDSLMAKFGHHGVTRPIFQPGDGIVFDHLAFHRTYFTEAMTRPRMSIEIRACHPEVLLKAYGEVDRITVRRYGDKYEMWYSRPVTEAVPANFPTTRLSSAAKRLRHFFRSLR